MCNGPLFEYVVCERCGSKEVIHDIGLCGHCLEEQANGKMAQAIGNGSLSRRLDEAKQFITSLSGRPMTTKIRRDIDEKLRNLSLV